MKLIVLHISDLHIKTHIPYFEDKINSISQIVNSDDFSDCVLILLSGDISFSGEKEQYELAKSFFDALISRINKKIKIAICPGNHDRKFESGVSITDEEVDSLNSDNFEEHFLKYESLSNNYSAFAKCFSNDREITSLNKALIKYEFTFEKDKVVVFSLNDSLVSTFVLGSTKESRSGVFLPNDMLNFKRGNEGLTILLTHIPLSGMREQTRNSIKDRCKKHIDFIVDGHTHEEEMSICENEVIELTSSAMHFNDVSGFSLIHVDKTILSLSLYSFDENTTKYIQKGSTKQEEFPLKIGTSEGLFVNQGVFSRFEDTKTIGGYDIGVDEIYVFPKLTEHKYLSSTDRRSVNNFSEFVDYVDEKNIVWIFGDQCSGKTTLSYDLYLNMIKHGCCPVVCNGDDFNSKKTKKTLKEQIDYQIRKNYLDEDSDIRYHEIEKRKRILIIDNSVGITDQMLSEFATHFDKIILFVSTETNNIFSIQNTANLPAAFLDLEFFYRKKREDLYRNIYHAISKRKPEILTNYTLSQFILVVEEAVEKVEQKIVIDLDTLISFCGNALLNINILNGSDSSFVANRYQQLISDALNNKKIEGINYFIVERIVSSIAFQLYKDERTLFDKELVESKIQDEIREYGDFSYTDADKIIALLMELKILKAVQNQLMFYSRNIFAHYIGFHAMDLFDNNGDNSCLSLIVSRGTYLPLNFAILMDIAVSRNNAKIPSTFIDMLTKDIDAYSFQNNDLKSIAHYFDDERQRIVTIDESDIEERKQLISKQEEKQRQEYLDNSNNYFYERFVSDDAKQLIELFNKNKILAILMNYGDILKASEKQKLCALNLLYPNIVIDKFITFTKRTFDDLYIKALENIEEVKADKNFENSLNAFFDFLFSYVTATILGIYDSSARPVHNKLMRKTIVNLVNNQEAVRSFMPQIQKLMFLSFSQEPDSFLKSLKECIDGTNNKYFIRCALLIGRRYVMDNYDEIFSKYRPFLEYMKAKSGKKSYTRLLINKK